MDQRGVLGRIGERIAVRHLEATGFEVLDRNWRCADGAVRGELDLVARDGPTLVVCEVKTRRGEDAGGALAAVTPAKHAQLRRLAAVYLRATGRSGDVRFDAVGVTWPRSGGPAVVEHVRGIDGWGAEV